MLGSRLRGETFDKIKAVFFLLIIMGYILRGVFGTYLFSVLKFNALLIPASICLLLALF
jgi:hypothetical protein